MDENNVIKISNITNLPALNIKSQLNMNIDSNTHIKQVLNIETCLMDLQIEPMLTKALFKGVVGVKVMYVDTDNMFNTLSDTTNFSETLNSEILSSDSQISINSYQFTTDFDNDEKSLRVNIDGSIDCMCNTNKGFNSFNASNNDLITKKTVLSTQHCAQQINKTTNYDFDFKLDSKISKILSCDSKIIVEDIKCCDGYIVVSGQIINDIVCEIENDNNYIKLVNNSTNFKCEIEASNCDNDCVADLSSYININSTQITTDINDSGTQFSFEYSIVVNGYLYKNINLDIIDDIYSLDSSLELVSNEYKMCKKMPYLKLRESVDTEITLAEELNVDEILGMINSSSSITQRIVKENMITVEGVISGNLLYLDENKEIKHLATQLPYSVNIKQDLKDEVCGVQLSVIPTSCKCKIKRGNTLMIDYELCICGSVYSQSTTSLVENVKYGKVFDYGDIAFQIYLAKAGESPWDLCKRLHITQEQLLENNKETPTSYAGGEKIIVYR